MPGPDLSTVTEFIETTEADGVRWTRTWRRVGNRVCGTASMEVLDGPERAYYRLGCIAARNPGPTRGPSAAARPRPPVPPPAAAATTPKDGPPLPPPPLPPPEPTTPRQPPLTLHRPIPGP